MIGFNITGDIEFNEDPTLPFGGAITLRISRDLLASIVAYIDSCGLTERVIWGIEVSWTSQSEMTGWRLPVESDDECDIADGLVQCFAMVDCQEGSEAPSMEAH